MPNDHHQGSVVDQLARPEDLAAGQAASLDATQEALEDQGPEGLTGDLPDQKRGVQGSAVRDQLLRPRTALSFLLAMVILAVFVTRSDLNLSNIWANIREANLGLLAGAFTIYYFTLFLRAVRWRWMLDLAGIGATTDTQLPGAVYLTGVYTISWLVNCIVPAKLGDAYRAYRVRRDDAVRYSIGFGTIIAERVFDLVVLVVMLSASVLLAFHGSLPGQSDTALYIGVAMVVVVTAGMLVMFFFREFIEARLPHRFRSHFTLFQQTLFQMVRNPAVPTVFAITIWFGESLRVYLVSESLGAGISFELAVFVALLSALLTTLPFTPAGLGVVEVAIVTALTFVDVPSDVAGSVAVLDRVITYWSAILIGGIVALAMMRRSSTPGNAVVEAKGPVQSTS
ncbi:lysylphosphatidylglycerol synthase transmembrane domain-containing protein [soil metagenome]